MEEDSKALTAFTVGPLGFYVYKGMPFGLINAPATFKWLRQSCLGNLHLQYCIIYLDDITVLRFTNYYQRFIKKYVHVAKPLYKLISLEKASKK